MADESTGVEYLVDLDFGDNGGVLRVRKIEKLIAWVEREQEFWGWLDDSAVRGANPLKTVVNHVLTTLSNLRTWVDQYKAGQDAQTNLDNFRRTAEGVYQEPKLLHSRASAAKFIDELRENVGKIEAAAALSTILGQEVDRKDLRQFRGSVAIANFLDGVAKETAAAERRALGQLAGEYRDRQREDTEAADILRDRLEELVGDHADIRNRGVRSMGTAVRLAREQAAEQRKEAAERLEEFEGLYNAKLALDAPVKYWRKKRNKHRVLTWSFFVLFITFIAVVTREAILYISGTMLADPAFWKDAGFEVIALALAAVGVVVALARVLLRLATSQLHLGNDADERVTMVNTYLALRQGGHADEQHMQTVLERLFAPATDGMVKEELGPVTAMEVIKAMTAKK